MGCGFVADYYMATLANHPELELVGVYDRNEKRCDHFHRFYRVPRFATLEAALNDPTVALIVNLTDPRSHNAVTKAALEAGKHVYSEKPFAMSFTEATALVDLAIKRDLRLISAPCSLLGETAQTVWKALRENRVGKVRLVYAEMDDGLVHRMPFRKWTNASGTPWPFKDEFEIGCTLEHAGYYLPWLTAFFGPAQSVTAFSSCLVPDKLPDAHLEPADTPDFSVALIQFASGIVARLTCSIVAPHDHSLRIIGDDGVLYVDDCWYYRAPVYTRRLVTFRRRTFLSPLRQRVKLAASGRRQQVKIRGAQNMDFCRGIAAMAAAIAAKEPCHHFSERFSLHNTELALAIHNAREGGSKVILTTTFDPLEPLPWAR